MAIKKTENLIFVELNSCSLLDLKGTLNECFINDSKTVKVLSVRQICGVPKVSNTI